MAKGNETATWSLQLDGNVKAEANAEAEALERLAQSIQRSQTRMADLSKASKRLTGDSAEVKTAQQNLAKEIDAEKAKITQNQLALLKSGTTLEQLAKKQKQAADQSKKLGTELGAAGEKVEASTESLFSAEKAMTLLTTAATALVGAVVAAGAALAAGAVALSKWIITSANAARTANLVREAVTGSATSAKNLGDHIQDLSNKLSTPKDKLQELALALAKTRLSGQAQVDTLNAVGQAADAMGDDVGNAIKDIAARGQLFGRLQVNPLELIGKGFSFDDLSAQVAKDLGVTIATAKRALAEGRVELGAGLKSLRATIEKRFGEINARKALDLNVQLEKMRDRLTALTRDVKLEPLLKGLETIGKDFDETTFTGKALHDMITAIGNALSDNFGKGAPIAHKMIQGLIIGALTAGISFLKLRNTLRDTFGADTLGQIDLLSIALNTAAAPGQVLAGALDAINATVKVGKALVDDLSSGWARFTTAANEAVEKIKAMSWADLGKAVVDGFVKGITTAASALVDAVEGLGDKVKSTFAKALGIHSPSKVFAEYGQHTTDGYREGVDKGSPKAQSAVDTMVGTPSSSSPASSAGGGGGSSFQVVINLPPGADVGAARELERQRPAIEASLLNVFRQLNAQQGGGAGVARG